jgi:hypothetical protein
MKEVAKAQKQEVVVAPTMDDWGNGPELSSNDIIIPKILAMQGLSQLVTARKAQIGEFRNSLTGELLGSVDKPVSIVPFYLQKLWVEYVPNEKGKMKFAGITPVTMSNENLAWEDKNSQGIVTRRRDYTLQFFCLLESDLAKDVVQPYVLSFKRTSLKAGKKLATQMYVTNKQSKMAPAGKIISLEGVLDSNDDGTFVVFDISALLPTPAKYQQKALEMFKLVQSGAAKVDTSDLEDEPVKETKYAEPSDKF